MRKKLSLLLSFLFVFQQAGYGQTALDLSGMVSGLRASVPVTEFRPAHLRYLSYDRLTDGFNLLLDKGDLKSAEAEAVPQAEKLMAYFRVGLSLPDDAFWVNLRPDSPERMLDDDLARTDVGRILLEADLQLKKDTAAFTSPDTKEGKEYWEKLYRKAEELYGSQENISIPTLTRPWIVPDEIIVRDSGSSAYIYKATLKVMLEQDYLKGEKTYEFNDSRQKTLNEFSTQLIRELIIPKITREVNSAKKYAELRQVYYSLILAQWFKKAAASGQLTYSGALDSRNTAGLTSKSSWDKNGYFQAYQKSFKDGEYNLQRHYSSVPGGDSIKSYFSGGIVLGKIFEIGSALKGTAAAVALITIPTASTVMPRSRNSVLLNMVKDKVMPVEQKASALEDKGISVTSVDAAKVRGLKNWDEIKADGTIISRPDSYVYTHSSLRGISAGFKDVLGREMLEEIVARSRELAGKRQLTVVDLGCGDASAIQDLLLEAYNGKLDNVHIIGFANMYFENWQEIRHLAQAVAEKGVNVTVELIYDDISKFQQHLQGKKIDILYSADGINNLPDPGGFLLSLPGLLSERGIVLTDTYSPSVFFQGMLGKLSQSFNIVWDKPYQDNEYDSKAFLSKTAPGTRGKATRPDGTLLDSAIPKAPSLSLEEIRNTYAVHATDLSLSGGVVRAEATDISYDKRWNGKPPSFHPLIHFALGELVQGHIASWDTKKYAVIVPLGALEKQLVNVNPYDTFILGDLKLPPGSIVLAPKGERILDMPPGVKVVEYDREKENGLRQAVDDAIRDNGGVPIRMIEEGVSTGDRAYRDGKDINSPEQFAPLLEQMPRISFGTHLFSERGEAFRFGVIDALLQLLNDPGHEYTYEEWAFFEGMLMQNLAILESYLQKGGMPQESMAAFSQKKTELLSWIGRFRADLYTRPHAAQGEKSLTIAGVLSSLPPDEMKAFVSNDTTGIFRLMNTKELYCKYAVARLLAVDRKEERRELFEMLDSNLGRLADSAVEEDWFFRIVGPYLAEDRTNRVPAALELMRRDAVRTFLADRYGVLLEKNQPQILLDLLHAHPITRLIFEGQVPPPAETDKSPRAFLYRIDSRLGQEKVNERMLKNFEEARLFGQRVRWQKETLPETMRWITEEPMSKTRPEATILEGTKLNYYEQLRQLNRQGVTNGDSAPARIWKSVGLYDRFRAMFSTDEAFWASEKPLYQIYRELDGGVAEAQIARFAAAKLPFGENILNADELVSFYVVRNRSLEELRGKEGTGHAIEMLEAAARKIGVRATELGSLFSGDARDFAGLSLGLARWRNTDVKVFKDMLTDLKLPVNADEAQKMLKEEFSPDMGTEQFVIACRRQAIAAAFLLKEAGEAGEKLYKKILIQAIIGTRISDDLLQWESVRSSFSIRWDFVKGVFARYAQDPGRARLLIQMMLSREALLIARNTAAPGLPWLAFNKNVADLAGIRMLQYSGLQEKEQLALAREWSGLLFASDWRPDGTAYIQFEDVGSNYLDYLLSSFTHSRIPFDAQTLYSAAIRVGSESGWQRKEPFLRQVALVYGQMIARHPARGVAARKAHDEIIVLKTNTRMLNEKKEKPSSADLDFIKPMLRGISNPGDGGADPVLSRIGKIIARQGQVVVQDRAGELLANMRFVPARNGDPMLVLMRTNKDQKEYTTGLITALANIAKFAGEGETEAVGFLSDHDPRALEKMLVVIGDTILDLDRDGLVSMKRMAPALSEAVVMLESKLSGATRAKVLTGAIIGDIDKEREAWRVERDKGLNRFVERLRLPADHTDGGLDFTRRVVGEIARHSPFLPSVLGKQVVRKEIKLPGVAPIEVYEVPEAILKEYGKAEGTENLGAKFMHHRDFSAIVISDRAYKEAQEGNVYAMHEIMHEYRHSRFAELHPEMASEIRDQMDDAAWAQTRSQDMLDELQAYLLTDLRYTEELMDLQPGEPHGLAALRVWSFLVKAYTAPGETELRKEIGELAYVLYYYLNTHPKSEFIDILTGQLQSADFKTPAQLKLLLEKQLDIPLMQEQLKQRFGGKMPSLAELYLAERLEQDKRSASRFWAKVPAEQQQTLRAEMEQRVQAAVSGSGKFTMRVGSITGNVVQETCAYSVMIAKLGFAGSFMRKGQDVECSLKPQGEAIKELSPDDGGASSETQKQLDAIKSLIDREHLRTQDVDKRLALTAKIGRLIPGKYSAAVYPCSGWDFLTIADLSEKLDIRKIVTIDKSDMFMMQLQDRISLQGRARLESSPEDKVRSAVKALSERFHSFDWRGDMDTYLTALALFGADEIVSVERISSAETKVIFKKQNVTYEHSHLVRTLGRDDDSLARDVGERLKANGPLFILSKAGLDVSRFDSGARMFNAANLFISAMIRQKAAPANSMVLFDSSLDLSRKDLTQVVGPEAFTSDEKATWGYAGAEEGLEAHMIRPDGGLPGTAVVGWEELRSALPLDSWDMTAGTTGKGTGLSFSSPVNYLRFSDKTTKKTVLTVVDKGQYTDIYSRDSRLIQQLESGLQQRGAVFVVDSPRTTVVTADFPEYFGPAPNREAEMVYADDMESMGMRAVRVFPESIKDLTQVNVGTVKVDGKALVYVGEGEFALNPESARDALLATEGLLECRGLLVYDAAEDGRDAAIAHVISPSEELAYVKGMVKALAARGVKEFALLATPNLDEETKASLESYIRQNGALVKSETSLPRRAFAFSPATKTVTDLTAEQSRGLWEKIGQAVDGHAQQLALAQRGFSYRRDRGHLGPVDVTPKGSDGGAPGGIDFRSLPIITQQAAANLKLTSGIDNRPGVDSVKEWQAIEKMVAAGMKPSCDRLREFVGICYSKGELGQYSEDILGCVAQILQMEETKAQATEPVLKDILIFLETAKTEKGTIKAI